MEFMFFVPFSILLAVFCIIVLVQEIRIAKNRTRTKPKPFLTFLEILFTIVGPVFGFIVNYESGEPIPRVWMPFYGMLSAIPVLSYWVSRFYSGQFSAFTRSFLKANMAMGIIVALLLTYYFIEIIPLGFVFAFYGFPLISPFMCALILYAEIRNSRELVPVEESHLLDDPRLTELHSEWNWNFQAASLSIILFVAIGVSTYLISGMPSVARLSLLPFDLNASGF